MKYLKRFENSMYYPKTSSNPIDSKIKSIVEDKISSCSNVDLKMMKNELDKFASYNNISFKDLDNKELVLNIIERKFLEANESFSMQQTNHIIRCIKNLNLGLKITSFIVAVLTVALELNTIVFSTFAIISFITTVIVTLSPILKEFAEPASVNKINKKIIRNS